MDIGGAAKDARGSGGAGDSWIMPGICRRSFFGGSVGAMFWIRVFDANLREFYKRPHRF